MQYLEDKARLLIVKDEVTQCVQYEVWTVIYFPFIRLLGLPIVDIHIYTGDCYTGVTPRADGPYYTDFKNNTNRASSPGIRNK